MSTLTQHLQQKFSGKKILILGWGREGQSSYATLRAACPSAELTVSDLNEDALRVWEREHHTTLRTTPHLTALESFDVIFKSPGIPIRTPELQAFLARGKTITTQLNEFLHVYRDQVTGITGTKGKSTTSSLIAHLLRSLGLHTLFAGNIGTPVFEVADHVKTDTQIVLEMSSYQLETAAISPHVAVFLNIYPEHLNYHQSMESYFEAKTHITTYQNSTDLFIFNQDVALIAQLGQTTPAQRLPFSYESVLNYPPAVRAALQQLDEVRLPATIKKWNILPALLALSAHDFTAAQIITALSTFTPLEHRLETIGTYRGVTWIDDTLATIPEATIAALESLPRVDVLLLGGYDRGIQFDRVVHACMTHYVPAIGFFQPSGQKMYDLLTQNYPSAEWPKMKLVQDMEDAVRFAYAHAPEGGVVVLSPSSPSFGQFKDYRDKSAQYRSWIKQLAEQ